MNKSDSIVIIPTYNEKENIEKIIRALVLAIAIVVDDASVVVEAVHAKLA